MDELKRRVKELVPENKRNEVDVIFYEWIANLKVHTIAAEFPNADNNTESVSKRKDEVWVQQVDEIKKRFDKFKRKMNTYDSLTPSDANLAIADVQNEINSVRMDVTKMKSTFKPDINWQSSSNAQLIEKLEEIKSFLEKLK